VRSNSRQLITNNARPSDLYANCLFMITKEIDGKKQDELKNEMNYLKNYIKRKSYYLKKIHSRVALYESLIYTFLSLSYTIVL